MVPFLVGGGGVAALLLPGSADLQLAAQSGHGPLQGGGRGRLLELQRQRIVHHIELYPAVVTAHAEGRKRGTNLLYRSI